MFNRKWSTRGAAVVGALMVAMLVTTTGPALAGSGPTVSTGHAHANVALRLRVNPNITAAVGQPVNFDVAAVNIGQADATNVEVGVPLDLGNLALTGASFTDKAAFVTGIFTDPSINLLVAHFADRLIPGQIVTGTFTFVPQLRALGLSMHGTTSNSAIANCVTIFEDEDTGGFAISNRVDFTIANDTASDGTGDRVQMADVVPYRKNVNNINIVARNFAPGEKLAFWINFPDGTAENLGFIDYADETGLYEVDNLDPQSFGLPAGNYSFVFHGYETNIDYVAPFTVK